MQTLGWLFLHVLGVIQIPMPNFRMRTDNPEMTRLGHGAHWLKFQGIMIEQVEVHLLHTFVPKTASVPFLLSRYFCCGIDGR